MRVMIDGGCGFLGSYLARKCEEEGHEVLVYDLDISRAEELFKGYDIKVTAGDVRFSVKTRKVAEEFKPHIIVHLAANAVASSCDEYPKEAYFTNVHGLCETLCSVAPTRFVFISSSFVYGDFQYVPVDENHVLNPKGIYGGSKLACENIVKTYCNRFGIDWTIIRPSAVYGIGDRNWRVVRTLLSDAIKGRELIVEGAEQVLDFTHVTDTVNGIYLASTKKEASRQIYNITKGEGRTLKELCEIIKRLEPNTKIIWKEHDRHRPQRGALDIYKAWSHLGYNPVVGLEEGVENYYRWMVENES